MGLNDTTIARRLAEKPKTGGVPGSTWGAPTQWGTAVWGGAAHGRPVGVQVPVPGSAYVDLPGTVGNFLRTPDAPELDIPGDLCIVTEFTGVTMPAANAFYVNKSASITYGYLAYSLVLLSDGRLQLFFETSAGTLVGPASTAGQLDVLTRPWQAICLDADDGTGTWKLYFWDSTDGVSWTARGTVSGVAGQAAVLRDVSALLEIGGRAAGTGLLDANINHVSIRNGIGASGEIGGSEVFRFDGDVDLLGVDPAATSFPCSTGQTITVLRSGDPSTTLVPTSLDDWYLVFERLDGSGATWGEPTKWGDVRWGTLEWTDITGDVRGVETRRGADEPNGRPRTSEVRITLDNETGAYDPWRHYPATRVGVIIRCGLASEVDVRAGGWLPQWCGVVDDWPVKFEGARLNDAADSWVTVTLVDTIAEVASVDDNALGGVVGNGDTVVPRVTRLLEAMAWRYGLVTLFDDAFSGGEPDYPLQSTDMASNRAAELVAVAESTRTVIRSDVTGACLVTTRDRLRETRLKEFSHFDIFGVSWGMIALTSLSNPDGNLVLAAYEPDSAITGNNRDGIYNRHRWARIGGVMQTFEHTVSRGRFGISTSTRTNLFNTTDAAVLELAQDANDWQARTALRLEAITVDVTPDILLALAAADLDDDIWFFPPFHEGFSGTAFGKIRAITDRITPQTDDVVNWQRTFAVDFYQFNDLPGAILDPAPR